MENRQRRLKIGGSVVGWREKTAKWTKRENQRWVGVKNRQRRLKKRGLSGGLAQRRLKKRAPVALKNRQCRLKKGGPVVGWHEKSGT